MSAVSEVAAMRAATVVEAPEGVEFGSKLRELGVEGFEFGDDLPAEFRKLLLQLVRVQVDVEGVLLFRDPLRDLIDLAPSPVHKMRFAKFYAEEIGHGYRFWKMYRELGGEIVESDFDGVTKAQYIFGYSLDTWLDLAVLNTIGDRMGVYAFQDMLDSAYLPWARLSRQVLADERGHCALGLLNLREICADSDGREAAQEALYKWYPAALDMFGSSTSKRQWAYVEWGLKAKGNEALRQEFVAEINPLLESLGLTPPDYTYNRRFL